MNKLGFLGIFTTICIVTSVHAGLNKNDLEKAIRSLDVEAVKQIIVKEAFTPMEFSRYLALADEIINERKFWVWRAGVDPEHADDPITTYLGPKTEEATGAWAIGSFIAIMSGVTLSDKSSYNSYSTSTKCFLIIGVIAGATLCVKGLYDAIKCDEAKQQHKTLLRKKYDDAVTIRQLIYTVHITEASFLIGTQCTIYA